LLLCSVGGIRAVLRLRIDLVKVGRGCVVVLCGVGDVDKFFKEPEKVNGGSLFNIYLTVGLIVY
jgi:hypothetical protein